MGLLEDMARVVGSGGFSPQSFTGPGYESVWRQLKPWLGRITTNGVMKWIPRAASQLPCQIPQYENGLPVGPCAHHALETCLSCHRPVCLNHAFIDGQGDAICYLCVVQMRAVAQEPREAPPPPPDAKAEARQKSWWAHGVLGIQEGVSWADVKKQYRALSAQYHPDRASGDESRFKDVQKAYDMLKLIYGEN